MDFQALLDQLNKFDPLYFVAVACLLIAIAIFRMAGKISRKIEKLLKEMERASDNITVADESRKREATLHVVRRFESDPEVRNAVRHIWDKTKAQNGTDYTLLDQDDRFQVISFLNYLDGVAVGLKQAVLDATVAREYLQHVVHKSVLGLLLGQSGDSWTAGPSLVEPDKFENLILLQKRWAVEEVHPLFRMIGHGVT